MSFFLYNKKDTPVHRLDPRVKIAGLLWLFLAAALAGDLLSLGMVCLLLLTGFIIAGSTGNILKMGWILLLVGGATFIMWLLSYKPAEGAQAGAGLMHAAIMTLRFIVMLLAGIFFLSVTGMEDLSNGLMLLKVPYAAAFAVSLSFRLVNTFISTGFLIVEAQEVRGNDATRGNIITRIKAYAPLLVPLILNGIKKAETLTLALESKAFSPQNKPDIAGRYAMKNTDTAALLILCLTAVIITLYSVFIR